MVYGLATWLEREGEVVSWYLDFIYALVVMLGASWLFHLMYVSWFYFTGERGERRLDGGD